VRSDRTRVRRRSLTGTTPSTLRIRWHTRVTADAGSGGLHQLPAGFGKPLKRRIAELTAEHTGRVGGAYGLADEVIGDPAGAPESGTPA
jgi:hypothetical protein